MSERQGTGRAAWEGELFRLLAENATDYAIFLLDGDGRIQAWTPGAERLLGYREGEILGQSVDVLYTPEDKQRGAPQLELEQARTAGQGEGDRWHVRKDGSRFWSSGATTLLRDEAGSIRGFAKIMRNRTEWKQAEQARRESEASKAAVLETALDGIITIDHEDRIVEFNPAAERLFGYRRTDVLGQKMGELIVPARLRPDHYRGMARYLATGEAPVLGKRLELAALRADGTEFAAELSIVRVPTEEAILFTGYLRDITERKMQERRRVAQLSMTQVLAEASTLHDAAPRILKTVCESLDWDVGGLWLVDRRDHVLRCLDVWRRPALDIGKFEEISREQTMSLGTGLPGRVWKSGKPLWLSDITADKNFPRLAVVAETGLHSAFAVPLLLGGQVLGVAEFLSQSAREPDDALLEMMGTIGGQIGQFIQRKHAEEALRESEERFRGVMEQAPFSMQIFSPDGRTLQVNRAWEELWGVNLNQIADYNILEDPQLATTGVLELIKRAFAGEAVTIPAIQYDPDKTIPEVTRHRDSRRWVSAVAYPLKYQHGRVSEVILVHSDVTAQKQAEDALRESEERFRGIVNHSVAGVAEVDLTGRFLFVNERYCQIVGRSSDELLRLRMQDISHQDDLPKNLYHFEQIGRSGTPYVIEKRYLRPDGSQVWVNNSVSGLRGPDGQVKSVVAVCVDVTERKRREEDLRFLADASHTLTTLVDFESTLQRLAGLAVPHFADWCAIYLPDGPDELRLHAVAHVDPLKVQLAEEAHKRWPSVLEVSGGVHEVYRTGQSVLVEILSEATLRHLAQDDEHLALLRTLGLQSYMCVPLAVRKSTIGVIMFAAAESGRRYTAADLALAEDLAHRSAIASENARLYSKLREEARKKDDFLAMLAHELRNPLAPIRSGLDLLGIMGTDSEVLDMMQQQIEHLVRLVEDLLDVSRIVRGKVQLRKEPVNLSSVVNSALAAARPLVEKHGQQLVNSMPPGSIWLNADAVRLAQVFDNLLNNASKYSEEGGRIQLSVEPKNEHVLIQVRDTGIGIGPDLLPHIFDLFTQDQRTIDRSEGGLGIGLTVAKSLVEMHGGTISVRSEGRGWGSEFSICLPTIAPHEHQSKSNQETLSVSPLTILVVDDNVPAAKMLGLLLKGLGDHHVAMAHDGIAALAAVEEHRPDLVLLDIGLPKLDGLEVARRLREHPEFDLIHLVALTGYGTDDDRRRSLDAGFDEHLVKPHGVDALKRLLSDVELRKR